MDKKEDKYSEISTVQKRHDELIPEEFPDGPFGSAFNKEEPVRFKSTPWEEGQKRMSAFVYPDEERHDELPRKYPGAHPLHDEDEE